MQPNVQLNGYERDSMIAHHERAYIRHPADIPLEVSPSYQPSAPGELRNLSRGGLAFTAQQPFPAGSDVTLVINCCPNSLKVRGQVVWCEARDGGYEVGIAFYTPAEAYQVRMVEQICQIEQYRQDVWRKEGRHLTQDEAAQEWISRYADQFAQTGWSD
ncbi:PilZ domain-containing protein [Marinobacter fonticola]|uniref:PilZ domain-containing protein n=1 Tax=Marinobacter fonticola TaxID=2603215 RepID=UPI0011E89D81|nr:PilZ domain-containing protein [Marinobacter fonticola]